MCFKSKLEHEISCLKATVSKLHLEVDECKETIEN